MMQSGELKSASLERLQDLIIRPGIEKKLTPILLYKGSRSLGNVQRSWNLALTMMESGAENIGAAAKIIANPDFSQLCIPSKIPAHINLRMFFGRLRDNPSVTDNIHGLTEYVEFIHPRDTSGLERISLFTSDPRCRVPWRIYEPIRKSKKIRIAPVKTHELVYPYIIHEGGAGQHELVMLVNNAVPKGLPEEWRADLCQDLIVGVLSGEISKDELRDSVKSYKHKLQKLFPDRYSHISLESMRSGDDRSFGELAGVL